MRYALITAFFSFSAAAQISDLAVSDDGQTLLLRSAFRLQGETDVTNQGKIYRFQYGQWTRLAAAPEQSGLVPPDVLQPFLTSDPQVFGWHTYSGCGACNFFIVPPGGSTINGITLPADFPRSNLRVSRNGRYFLADRAPFPGVKYLDLATGATADVPVMAYSPNTRDIANDGTALILVTAADDPGANKTPAALSLWRPGFEPHPVYSGFISRAVFSANGRMIAVESTARPGIDGPGRNLFALDAQTGEQIPIGLLPAGTSSGLSISQAAWDTSGVNLIYRGFDDRGQPVSVMLWNTLTRSATTLFSTGETITNVAIGGDGTLAWAITGKNRLLRIDLLSGGSTEILTPLPGMITVEGRGVPGSAAFLFGTGFAQDQQAFDGATALPLIDNTATTYSFQIPWEFNGTPPAVHIIGLRSRDNPFESVVKVYIVPSLDPQFAPTRAGGLSVKAVHDDFSALVTSDLPARPGETLHIYMTGLGPVDQPVATGEPGPFSPPAKPLVSVTCSLELTQPLDVPFAAYAAGLVGVYQIDVTMPDHLPDRFVNLNCRAAGMLAIGDLPATSAR